ncbi:MAG: LPP20 family lipoprotein, partial [Thiovulaceae bacterium]|nr:LPP20 family lipoprotein [Sulfurimonadaceae bacterium]
VEVPLPIAECSIDKAVAPSWACGMVEGYDDMITSVGTARMSKAGAGFTRRNAMANGRSNLAQQIETVVKDKVETFTRSTGIAESETVDTVATQVSKQVAKVSLNGSKQLAYWQHPGNNDIYLLMGVTKESVNTSAKDNVISSFKDQDALWQQFQAKNALESLDKEFETK